jgi:Phage integrase, N-terminal SAM-like domain
LRTRHYSPLTVKAYVFWVRHFLQRYWFCRADDLGEREVAAFLSELTGRGR